MLYIINCATASKATILRRGLAIRVLGRRVRHGDLSVTAVRTQRIRVHHSRWPARCWNRKRACGDERRAVGGAERCDALAGGSRRRW